jgi:hypothetical protein
MARQSTPSTWGSFRLRTERTFVEDGLRYRIVEQQRKRLGPKPLQRTRYAASDPDPATFLPSLDVDLRKMAERVLREGAFKWRRWSTICRNAGSDFSPYVVETELLTDLCRRAGLTVVDRYENGSWVPQRFRIDERVRLWLGIEGPEIREQLAADVTEPSLLAAIEEGRPRGFTWKSYDFVIRACQQLHEFARHDVRPGRRELAGLIDHTKAWTPARMALVEALMEKRFRDLVAPEDRQIVLRGPVAHSEGGLWASQIEEFWFEVAPGAQLVVLIENLETFKFLLPLADIGAILIQVPGGPPPAEVELVARLAALAPDLPVYAAFDLDPAGVRIAESLSRRARVPLHADLMDPALLDAAPRRLALGDWDRRELKTLAKSGPFRGLRMRLEILDAKVEQETIQRELEGLLRQQLSGPQPAS